MLVDALVGIAVVALTVGATMRVLDEGLHRAKLSELRTLARLEAQSRLAEVGGDIPLASGVTTGTDGELQWRVEVGAAAAAYQVDVDVTQGSHELADLHALRLAS